MNDYVYLTNKGPIFFVNYDKILEFYMSGLSKNYREQYEEAEKKHFKTEMEKDGWIIIDHDSGSVIRFFIKISHIRNVMYLKEYRIYLKQVITEIRKLKLKRILGNNI